MAERYEMRFGGTGGQGMMLMGDIMSEAIGIHDGKEVLLLKSYGPEARGGACRSELAASDTPIHYPVVTRPNFLLAMSQDACNQYAGDLVSGGTLLVDSDFVKKLPDRNDIRLYLLPITRISVEVAGKALNANVVALGAISVLSDRVRVEAVRSCVAEHFPERLRAVNEKAFDAGAEAAKELLRETRS